MNGKHLFILLLFASVALLTANSTANACTAYIGDYVWFDVNDNGAQDEDAAYGLNDVQVIIFRDFGCDGNIDSGDVIYDYVFTHNDAYGNPGYYSLYSNASADGSICYVVFPLPATIPAGLFATTPEAISFPLYCADRFDVDFGYGDQPGDDDDDDDDNDNDNDDDIYGCTLTPGYWKTHSEFGPAPYDATWALLPEGADTAFYLSGQSYYDVLWTAPKGNVYYILAHQFIAAGLNQLNEASIPADALSAYEDAATLFGAYTPAQAKALRGAARNQFTELAGVLDDYNNGLIGPGHCDDDDDVDKDVDSSDADKDDEGGFGFACGN